MGHSLLSPHRDDLRRLVLSLLFDARTRARRLNRRMLYAIGRVRVPARSLRVGVPHQFRDGRLAESGFRQACPESVAQVGDCS